MDRKIIPSLPDKEKFNRDLYFIPSTNRSSKFAKQLYGENWKIFEEQINSMKLGHKIKLELARDFIAEIKERNITDENLLNAMKRSFAARIGRQNRQALLEDKLPKFQNNMDFNNVILKNIAIR